MSPKPRPAGRPQGIHRQYRVCSPSDSHQSVAQTTLDSPDREGRSHMRDIYHDELDDIGKTLVTMTNLVRTAMDRATTALLDGDLAGAERVISGDPQIDALREGLDDRTFQMIARQQPVATDLRVLVTTVHLAADLE